MYPANRHWVGRTLSLPVGLARGENNRLGYVRRSWNVGLMDGGSIPPGSTIWAAEIAISGGLPVPLELPSIQLRRTPRQQSLICRNDVAADVEFRELPKAYPLACQKYGRRQPSLCQRSGTRHWQG